MRALPTGKKDVLPEPWVHADIMVSRTPQWGVNIKMLSRESQLDMLNRLPDAMRADLRALQAVFKFEAVYVEEL